ncbi:MAG TPA: response regulator [Caldithrix abyssi]|uniref:Response regulator n=1 Tax=Caldithrix abyssi TaxID=187145 RepID=A0A7V4U0E6_CALAY|nr:response regulator [Caldithrix abyssi]
MSRIHILIIEDDEDHAFLEQDILTDELDCTIDLIASKRELTEELIEKADIVLLDFNLPDALGDEILNIIHNKSDIPVVIITGDEQLQTAIRTLKSGAADFLVKSPQSIALLPQTVIRTLKDYETRKTLEREQKEKEELNTKIETLKQVLTTLAHYINNSTTTISGYSQLCIKDLSDQTRCEKLAKIGIRETHKITLVLQELERFVTDMEIKTTHYANIPDAMFAIEENLKKKMDDLL